jgi:hypothetical protein
MLSMKRSNQVLYFKKGIREILISSSSLVKLASVVEREVSANENSAGGPKYHSSNQWSQGLISAADKVLGAAESLSNQADKEITSTDKIQIMCTQINSATVQLVTAATVKADPSSENLSRLTAAGNAVSDGVKLCIAICKQTELDSEAADITLNLTPFKSKVLEMEAQVKIMGMEKELERARKGLAKLRTAAYTSKSGSESTNNFNRNSMRVLPAKVDQNRNSTMFGKVGPKPAEQVEPPWKKELREKKSKMAQIS